MDGFPSDDNGCWSIGDAPYAIRVLQDAAFVEHQYQFIGYHHSEARRWEVIWVALEHRLGTA